MAKILLVEDDVNLREIYSARFAAETYEVITASDGEEALATAVRERPDLIVLDVMMPKMCWIFCAPLLKLKKPKS